MPVAEKFSNVAYISVTESAANTLTFSKLETGIAPFEKRGWLISRLEYHVNINTATFGANSDYLEYGLTASNSITALELSDNAVIDFNQIRRMDIGTAASGLILEKPLIKDLSTIAGGGILVPPNPIYIAAKGSNLDQAATVRVRLFYTSVDLKGDEFWELVEMRRMVGT